MSQTHTVPCSCAITNPLQPPSLIRGYLAELARPDCDPRTFAQARGITPEALDSWLNRPDIRNLFAMARQPAMSDHGCAPERPPRVPLRPFPNVPGFEPFTPDANTSSRVIDDLGDPYLTLHDVACKHHTTVEALVLWIQLPDIAHRLSVIDSAVIARSLHTANNYLRPVAAAMSCVIDSYLSEINRVPVNPDSLHSLEQRRRTHETARRAGALLLRLARHQAPSAFRSNSPSLRERAGGRVDSRPNSPRDVHDVPPIVAPRASSTADAGHSDDRCLRITTDPDSIRAADVHAEPHVPPRHGISLSSLSFRLSTIESLLSNAGSPFTLSPGHLVTQSRTTPSPSDSQSSSVTLRDLRGETSSPFSSSSPPPSVPLRDLCVEPSSPLRSPSAPLRGEPLSLDEALALLTAAATTANGSTPTVSADNRVIEIVDPPNTS